MCSFKLTAKFLAKFGAGSVCLKWYYDENRIFPIEAILKHKQASTLYEKKNAAYFFQISLFIPEIFKFLKYAN